MHLCNKYSKIVIYEGYVSLKYCKYFRLPLKRPDILQMWMNAIGNEFIPRKSHLICSAHFVPTDFMERPNASGVRLKNLAVPSLFVEAPASVTPMIKPDVTPAFKSNITPAIEFGTTVAVESDISSEIECGTISAIESNITLMKFDTIPAPTSVLWKSILIPKEDNATVLASVSSVKTQSASATDDTVKIAIRKSRKVMDSSYFKLKKQEIPLRKKRIWRTIKTLRQKLRRKEEKINSLENLLKTLWYGKLSSKH